MACRTADNPRLFRSLRLDLTSARYTLTGRQFKPFRNTGLPKPSTPNAEIARRALWRPRHLRTGFRARLCQDTRDLAKITSARPIACGRYSRNHAIFAALQKPSTFADRALGSLQHLATAPARFP